MLHSAVAILKLAQMDFTPANALFLRTMLLKKYALPYRVVDALVDYFETFLDAPDIPPVVWQQTLLAFAQHYKVPTPRPARPDPHPRASSLPHRFAPDESPNLSIHRTPVWMQRQCLDF